MAGLGQPDRRGAPDARRRARDDRRTAFGVCFEARHQRTSTAVGNEAEPSHVHRVHAPRSRLVDVVVDDPGGQFAQRDARFEAGQRGAQAEVPANPEAGHGTGVTLEVVAVACREHRLVAVGRPDQQQHPLARRDGGAVQLDLGGGDPRQHLGGRVVAKRLLNPMLDVCAVAERLGPLLRVPPGPVPGVAQQLRGGLVAGHDHQEQEGDDLVVAEAVAVDLGVHQRRGHVVGRLDAPGSQHVGVVAGQREGRVHRRRWDVLDACFTVDQQVRQAPQVVAVRGWNAHQLRHDVHRQPASEVGDEVELAALQRRVEVAAGQLEDAGLELDDPTRREALRHERPHAGVPGRVHRQEASRCARPWAPRRRDRASTP